MRSCILCAPVLLFTAAVEAQDLAELNESGFPLDVGNRWEYAVSVSHSNDAADRFDFESEAIWEIAGRDPVFGQDAFRMVTTHRFLSGPDSGSVATGETWFSMREDTLRALASRNTGALDPAEAQLFKRLQEDDARDPWDVVTLVFPLSVGLSWGFGPFFANDRKEVEAEEEVSVPAGRFQAFRVVRAVSEGGFGLRSEQWFTAIGLVKMRHELISSETRTNELGEAADTVTEVRVTEMVLERFHLAGTPTNVPGRSWARIKGGTVELQ